MTNYFHPKAKGTNVFWRRKAGGFYAVNGAYTAAGVVDPLLKADDVYICDGIGGCSGYSTGEGTENYFSLVTAQTGIRYPHRKVQVTQITTPSAPAVLNGSYVSIYSAGDETAYYIWFNKDGTTTDPAPPGKTAIEVPIAAADSAAEVAAALRGVLDGNPDFSVSDKSIYTVAAADQNKVIVRTVKFGVTTASSSVLWTGGVSTETSGDPETDPEKSAQYRFGGEAEEEEPPAPNTPLIERATEDPSDGPLWEEVEFSIPPVYESGTLAGSLDWQGVISGKIRTLSYDSSTLFADRHMGKPFPRCFHSHPYNDERTNVNAPRSKEYVPLDIEDPRTRIDSILSSPAVRDFLDLPYPKYIIYENGYPVERVPSLVSQLGPGPSGNTYNWTISGVCLREIEPAFPGDTNPDIGLWIYAMMYFGDYWNESFATWDRCGQFTCGIGGCPAYGYYPFQPTLALFRKRYKKDYAPGNVNRLKWEDPNWAFGLIELDGVENTNPWQLVGQKSLQHPDINWKASRYWPGIWQGGFGSTVSYEGSYANLGFGGEANYNDKVGHFSPDGNKFVLLQQYQNQSEYFAGDCGNTDARNVYQWSYGIIFPASVQGNVFGRALVLCDISDGDSGALTGSIQNPRYIDEEVRWEVDISSTFYLGGYNGIWNGATGTITHEHTNPVGGGLNGKDDSTFNGSIWVAADFDHDNNLVEIYLTKTWSWTDTDAPTEPYIEYYEITLDSALVNPDFECEDPPCSEPPPIEGCPNCGCKTLPLLKDYRNFERTSGKDVTWRIHGLTPSPLVVRRELFYRREEGFWHFDAESSQEGGLNGGCKNIVTDLDLTGRMIKAGYSTTDHNAWAAGIMIHCLDARSKSAVISQNTTAPQRFEIYNNGTINHDGEATYKTEVIIKGNIEYTHTYATASGGKYPGNEFLPISVGSFPRTVFSDTDLRSLVHDDKDSISMNWHFNHPQFDWGSPLQDKDDTCVGFWDRDGLRLAPPLGERRQWHWNDGGDLTFGYPHYWNQGNGQCRSRLTEQGVSVIFSCPGLPVLLRRGHYDFQIQNIPTSWGDGYGDDSLTGGPEWLNGWWFGDDANGDDEVNITDPLGLVDGDGDYGVWAQIVTV